MSNESNGSLTFRWKINLTTNKIISISQKLISNGNRFFQFPFTITLYVKQFKEHLNDFTQNLHAI